VGALVARARFLALRTLWRTLLRARIVELPARIRCEGSCPADCWIPAPEGGYYRGGILRQYCLLFTGHQGDCLAEIDDLGHSQPAGARFTPEVPER
jgi:hypothetical protein